MLIIELASSPGGVDVCAARELCANVMWAPSLPGKYAPESAGRIICECVLDVLGGIV
jgi:dipicolinate synthase subunit A